MAFTNYDSKTSEFIPNHESIDFGIKFMYKRFHVGAQFRPMSVNLEPLHTKAIHTNL